MFVELSSGSDMGEKTKHSFASASPAAKHVRFAEDDVDKLSDQAVQHSDDEATKSKKFNTLLEVLDQVQMDDQPTK